MNCREIEPLLFREHDGVLSAAEAASLGHHVANCAACRELRTHLTHALDSYRADVAKVPVPDVATEWLTLRAKLSTVAANPTRKRRFAPVIWFALPLAAAAALAFAFVRLSPHTTDNPVPAPEVASADYVETGNTNAATMVYVDKDSGWLVVWASDGDTGAKS
jgi:Putative zinc-finger